MPTLASSDIQTAVDTATRRVAPLWPLSRFVAVNPFVGLADTPFVEATEIVGRASGSPLTLPPAFYRERFTSGVITPADLLSASREAFAKAGEGAVTPTVESLIAALQAADWTEPAATLTPLPSALHDAAHGTRWSRFFVEEASKWCAAYYDEGQALWRFPWKGIPLFAAWRQAAACDRNPEVAGLPGWRSFAASLGDDPRLEIERGLRQLKVPAPAAADFCHRLLMSISGWAGHLQFRAHEKALVGEKDDAIVHLLAIRMAGELALHARLWNESLAAAWNAQIANPPGLAGSAALAPARIWQRALECARQRELFGRMAAAPKVVTSARPDFQAVFCIDVRSEIYRRSLESVAPTGQTIGFAGFFGFPIEAVPAGETHGTPQCPVLLTPAVKVPAQSTAAGVRKIGSHKRSATAWGGFKSAAISSFVFVETAGLGFAAKFARDLTHHSKTPACSSCGVATEGIALDQRVGMAAGALRHMGFAGGGLARVVLLCGHGSETANNPYGSSLDCGACGGHTGEANARTAAAILNDPAVRKGLGAQGIELPADTWFVAGLHNTTTDAVTLFDVDAAPATHAAELTALQRHLDAATAIAQKERSPLLGENPAAPGLAARIRERSHDWSQVRPEWGLAGNYAFIAAPRFRTAGLKLDGRVFLHDYRYEADAGEATLELLLAAPVVVASWINLQYFASTVDNGRFGAGNKTLHNVAAAIGVYEGNGGDLRVGLPFQSVHDGQEWRHEPLRLSVCVEAPPEAMNRILEKHPEVAALVANEWIHLFAIGASGAVSAKSDGCGGWTPVA